MSSDRAMPETIHLIRHGQSRFNAAFDGETGLDPMIFDAPLSELGRRQVAALRSALEREGEAYELAVTTPFTRAIETCVGLFEGRGVPVVVEALHREYLVHSCDVGRSPRTLARAFPTLSFGHLDDPWWYAVNGVAIAVEPAEILMTRVAAFRRWLGDRPERRIAVVGHGTFFRALTGLGTIENCQVVPFRP